MVTLSFDPQSKKVKQDEETFLRLIGECVSKWAFLDRELFNIVHAALGIDAKRAAIVFYSSAHLDAHLRLVDRLMKHGLSQSDYDNKWTPLRKAIDLHLATRSIYAHQPIKRTGAGKGGRAFYYYSIHIEPAERPLDREYRGLGGKPELLEKDLRKHAYSLEKLVKHVSGFSAAFQSAQPSP